MKHYIILLFIIATAFVSAQESNIETNIKWAGSRPDGHAPISVMGDHTHGKGEIMLSYRYMFMNMEDVKRGNDDADFANLLMHNGGKYMVTPTKMPMNIHMLGVMYAPSDNITLMAMFNYIAMDMNHLTDMGAVFTARSSGFADIKLSMMYKFFNKNRQQLHGNIDLSIPTGSIDNTDAIHHILTGKRSYCLTQCK